IRPSRLVTGSHNNPPKLLPVAGTLSVPNSANFPRTGWLITFGRGIPACSAANQQFRTSHPYDLAGFAGRSVAGNSPAIVRLDRFLNWLFYMNKILVIDHDEALRTALAATLQQQGFEVLQATTGVEGMQIART